MEREARTPDSSVARWVPALGLAGAALAALVLRSLGWEWVRVGSGDVVLPVGDGQYLARLVRYSLENFPQVLVWDSYINYPDGSTIQQPPLYVFLLAATVRLLGGSAAAFNAVLTWWSPLFGALTVIPVYLVARRIASWRVALGAAWLFAALPIVVTASRVGDIDQHAFVAMTGAWLLAVCLAAVSPGVDVRRLVLLGIALAGIRFALPLCWSGSLVYTGLSDGLLVLAGALTARRSLLAMTALGLASAGAALGGILAALPEPVGGPWSGIAFSRLHVWAPLAAAGVAATAWWIEGWRPADHWRKRLLRIAGIGVAAAALSVLLPGLLQGLLLGVAFVGPAEASRAGVYELLPLFGGFGRPAGQSPVNYFGWFAYCVPLAPLAALIAARGPRRPAALLLAAWSAVLAAMTVRQARFGVDFAASGTVLFALGLAQLARLAIRGGVPDRAARVAAVAIAVAMLWMPIRYGYFVAARGSLAALRGNVPLTDRALQTPSGSLQRFLETVRRVTPETSGYLDGKGAPEYGFLNSKNIGHAIHHVAHRAATLNGTQPLLGPENAAAAARFFELESEAEALAVARDLRARYVITDFFPGRTPGSIGAQLYFQDGRGSGTVPPLQHMRLITEGPRSGVPISDLFGVPRPAQVVPYKLFEIVPGALLEVPAAAGASVSATVKLETPTGRSFTYRTRAVAGPGGIARLRLPYATDASHPVRSKGSYLVRAPAAQHSVFVTDRQVLRGEALSPVGAAR